MSTSPCLTPSNSGVPVTIKFRNGTQLEINLSLFREVTIMKEGFITKDTQGRLSKILYHPDLLADEPIHEAHSPAHRTALPEESKGIQSKVLNSPFKDDITGNIYEEIKHQLTQSPNQSKETTQEEGEILKPYHSSLPSPHNNCHNKNPASEIQNLKFNCDVTNPQIGRQEDQFINYDPDQTTHTTEKKSKNKERRQRQRYSRQGAFVYSNTSAAKQKSITSRRSSPIADFSSDDNFLKKIVKKVKTEYKEDQNNPQHQTYPLSQTKPLTNELIIVPSSPDDPSIARRKGRTREFNKNVPYIPKWMDTNDPFVMLSMGRWVMPAHYHVHKLEKFTRDKIVWRVMAQFDPSFDTITLADGTKVRLWGVIMVPEKFDNLKTLKLQVRLDEAPTFPESKCLEFVNRLKNNPSKYDELLEVISIRKDKESKAYESQKNFTYS